MTEQELAAIEARANAATPAPWSTTRYSGGLSFSGPLQVYKGTNAEYGEPAPIPQSDDDAAFIAAARTDIPALVSEVRRLRKMLVSHLAPDLQDAALASWGQYASAYHLLKQADTPSHSNATPT